MKEGASAPLIAQETEKAKPTLLQYFYFYFMQYIGLALGVLGSAIVCSFVPLDKMFGIDKFYWGIIAFFILGLGGILHEFRPYKVCFRIAHLLPGLRSQWYR